MKRNLELMFRLLSNFSSRRFGKSHSAVELTKKTKGVMVCCNRQQAKQINEEHGIPTYSVDNLQQLLGVNKPIIFDQDAFTFLLPNILKTIEEGEAHKDKLDDIKRILGV